MAAGVSLVVALIAATPFVGGTLLLVSLWGAKSHRKWFYLLLSFNALGWVLILEPLSSLLGVSRAWQNGVDGALFALMVPTLVLLYRHRRDPDPPDVDAS